MDEKCYNVRLYVTHDMDLVSLYLRGYHLSLAIHEALTALCEGRVFRYRLTDNDGPEKNGDRVISLKVRFDRESEAVSLLERLPPRNKNMFLKNVLRLYLLRPYESFLSEQEDSEAYFASKFDVFERTEETDLPVRSVRRLPMRRKESVQKRTEDVTIKEIPLKGDDLTDLFLTMV
ncbi:MAG: hypothetical protein IJH60_00010 [Eubacterium sp.]|nr:hypothetical protein [Eubacterium sp.]